MSGVRNSLSYFFMFILTISVVKLRAQGNSKFEFSGYLKYMQTIQYKNFGKDWMTESLFHNRLNFKYYPSEHLTFALGMRNRFIYGDFVKSFPEYATLIGKDPGFADMSFNLSTGNSYILNTTIDRFYVDYQTGNFQARLGRHRINWGMNLIWNPNDVFNAYSYFDFDYEERTGTDALLLRYYTGSTSSAEFVYQLGDSLERMSFMGNYRFNKWNYDFQFLGGYSKGDLVLGTGWSGDIKGGGFRGEATYFYGPDSLRTKNIGQLMLSISGDYTFKSSLYLQFSILYNSRGTTGKAGFPNPAIILSQTSAKYLTFSRADLFGQISYQFTPLLMGGFASIYNPFDRSAFMGPMLSYSLSDNIELLFSGQLFLGENGTEFGDVGQLIYFRFKWSF